MESSYSTLWCPATLLHLHGLQFARHKILHQKPKRDPLIMHSILSLLRRAAFRTRLMAIKSSQHAKTARPEHPLSYQQSNDKCMYCASKARTNQCVSKSMLHS
ncbi:hypothetical protein POPTR_007G093825v4 [Populus trichocarpa]|uniref:Uncharacterized protein n=1 Tax=Populus trichocarpa TaxID=3694 RepID=A0ACC0SQK7_POPTR|nr:hypothetical protein BDE02_07G088400 [Populus trichocarpa]KAI9391490.1 hypothetical protein POPTR_007G093825v4 [Populus trichocarpa]